MTNVEEIRASLAKFDGKAVTLLGEAEAQFRGEPAYSPDYLDALISLTEPGEGVVGDGASWLIKSALEKGAQFSPDQVAALLTKAPLLTRWAAQLHLLQCVQHLTIPATHAPRLAALVRPSLMHERPFVRAWALDALSHLARQHPSFSEDFAAALCDAYDDPAASVRARARNLRD